MTSTPARARDLKIVLGVCGSVAALGVPQAVLWMRANVAESIVAVPSDAAGMFVTNEALRHSGCTSVVSDWDALRELGVDHVTLANWPDLVLIYPSTANTIGKLAAGIADSVLSTLALATQRPVFVAPSMNALMWNNPIVQRNVAILLDNGITVVGPSAGFSLSTGEIEIGSPERLEALFTVVAERLQQAEHE